MIVREPTATGVTDDERYAELLAYLRSTPQGQRSTDFRLARIFGFTQVHIRDAVQREKKGR
jgi:hypothetical protein